MTSPSSGVGDLLRPADRGRAAAPARAGYDVVVGECMADDLIVSAPKEQRAAELVAMPDRPVRRRGHPAVGRRDGDRPARPARLGRPRRRRAHLAGRLERHLDRCCSRSRLRLGWAALHGWNLADTPYAAPDGLLHWLDLAAATGEVTQTSPGRTRDGWDDYVRHPGVRDDDARRAARWSVLGGGDVELAGRLVGGCVEVVTPLAGTPYGDVAAFGREHADEGLLVYLEVVRAGRVRRGAVAARAAARRLVRARERRRHRPHPAPDADKMTQHEAVADALGMLGVPVVLDADIGHTQPFLPLVNGALGAVSVPTASEW